MQKSFNSVLIFFSLISFLSVPAIAQNFDKTDWKLKTEKGNLKVYTRNNKQSDVKEIRIKTTVKASAKKIVAVLNNVEGYPNWVYKCMEAKKIKINSSNDYYYYTKSDFPFPISDRDLVIHSNQWEEESTGYIYSHSKAVADVMSEVDGIVRITVFDGYWKIMPQKDGTVDIDYVALTHPGGSIPAWVVNLGITKGPLETMKNFANLVEVKTKKERRKENREIRRSKRKLLSKKD